MDSLENNKEKKSLEFNFLLESFLNFFSHLDDPEDFFLSPFSLELDLSLLAFDLEPLFSLSLSLLLRLLDLLGFPVKMEQLYESFKKRIESSKS